MVLVRQQMRSLRRVLTQRSSVSLLSRSSSAVIGRQVRWYGAESEASADAQRTRKPAYDMEFDVWRRYNRNLDFENNSVFDGGFSFGSSVIGFFIGASIVYGYWKFVDDTAEFSLGGDDDEEEEGEGTEGEGAEAVESKESAPTDADIARPPVNEKIENFRKRFEQYAKVEKDGELFMDQQQFIDSILPPGPASLPFWAAYPKIIQQFRGGSTEPHTKQDSFLNLLFELADANKDRLISFPEYAFFLTLLSYSPRQYKSAFTRFDEDRSGTISLAEFRKALMPQRSDIAESVTEIPLMKQWFGEDGTKQLSFEDFSKFIESLRMELLRREFEQHDLENRGMISVEAFHNLITNNSHLNSIAIPDFKRHLNLLKTNGFFKPSGRVSFETFAAFHRMSEQMDDIADAIHAVSGSGKPLNKANFSRAVRDYSGIDLSPKETDLIFAIFDRNHDGTIDADELRAVLQSRSSRAHLFQEQPSTATA